MTDLRRLLVIGGSGFLGRHLCALARHGGWEVHATHLTSPVDDAAAIHWSRCDVTNVDTVQALIESVTPTHIVNAAYTQSGNNVHAVCCDAAVAIAEAAALIRARFVHVSTDLVFDGELGQPYSETDPVSPLSTYGEAKASSEVQVSAALPSAATIRTSLIYGDPTAPQEQLVQRAHDQQLGGDDTAGIAFFTDEWRSPVHVDDLAKATLALLDTDHAGLLHVAGNERLSRLQFAQLLATALGLDARKLVGRTQDPALGPRAKDVSLNTDLAQSLNLGLPGPTERLADGYC